MPPGLNRRLSLIVDMSSKAALAGLKQLQGAVNAVSASAARVGAGAMQGFAALQKGATAATGAMQRLGTWIRSGWMIASIAISAASAAIGIFINKTAAAYQQMQSAIIGLRTIAKGYGFSGDAAEAAARQLEKSTTGFLDMGSAAQALKNLMGAGLDLPRATEQVRAMTEQAIFNRQTHYSVAQAVMVATEGIRNNMSIAADATGTTKNLALMTKEYARALGLNWMELTKEQVAEAAYIGFMEQATRSAGDFARALGTAQGQQITFGFGITKVLQAIGEFTAQIKWGIGNAFVPYMKQLREWIAAHRELIQQKTTEWVKTLTVAIAQAIETGVRYGKVIMEWIDRNGTFIIEVGKAAVAVGVLAVAISYWKHPMLTAVAALVTIGLQSSTFRGILKDLAQFINENKGLLLVIFGAMVVSQAVTGIRSIMREIDKLQFKIYGLASRLGMTSIAEAIFGGTASMMSAPALGAIGLIAAALALLWSQWDDTVNKMQRRTDDILKRPKAAADLAARVKEQMAALGAMPADTKIVRQTFGVAGEKETPALTATRKEVSGGLTLNVPTDISQWQATASKAKQTIAQLADVAKTESKLKVSIPGGMMAYSKEEEARARVAIKQAQDLDWYRKEQQKTQAAMESTSWVPQGEIAALREVEDTAGAMYSNLAELQAALIAPKPTKIQQGILQWAADNPAIVEQMLSFRAIEQKAEQPKPAAAVKTEEQMEAMNKLKALQDEINMGAMTGYAKEIEGINQKRDARIVELADLQKKAGVEITLTENTLLADKESAMARAELNRKRQEDDQKILDKTKSSMTELALLGMTETKAELARIEAVRVARHREIDEMVKELNEATAQLSVYGPWTPEEETLRAQQAQLQEQTPGLKAGIDKTATTETTNVVKAETDKQKQIAANKLQTDLQNFRDQGLGHSLMLDGMMASYEIAMNVMGAMGKAFVTGQKGQWRSLAAASLESIAMIMRALAQQYAAMSVGALIGSATDPRNFAKAAQYGAQAMAASVGAGMLEGMASKQQDIAERMNARENAQAQEGLNRATGGGGAVSVGTSSAPASFASVSVQKEPNITISPSVTIEAGHDVFIGEGSVEEFKVSLERVMVQSIKDAMSTGQIKVGRG